MMKRALMTAAGLLFAAPLVLWGQAKPKPGAAAEGEWYQFLGPKRDGHSPDTGLLKEWTGGGPALLWKAKGLGNGYSSVSLFGGKIYTMGETSDGVNLVCLSAADGKLLWTSKLTGPQQVDYPGTRSTPATDGRLVYTITPHGDLVAAAAANGAVAWKAKLDGNRPGWGFSESPLLDGNLVVCTPGGGSGTVAAYNKATGALAWRSKDLTDAAAYASIVPIQLGKASLYLVYTAETIAGVVPANGAIAFKAPRKGQTAVIPSPVYSNGTIFVSSGYGVGCNGFNIALAGNSVRVQEAYAGKQIINHLGGLVAVGDHVYGISDNGGLKCVELKTGKEAWASGSVRKGGITYADGHLYCRAEGDGAMTLVEASPVGYKEKGRFAQPDRSDKQAWAYPVVAGGKLYLRDQDTLLCYDVKAK
jgi:outer membrane protein assembly factor BamB